MGSVTFGTAVAAGVLWAIVAVELMGQGASTLPTSPHSHYEKAELDQVVRQTQLVPFAFGASILTAFLQIVNTAAQVIQKRDELRYNSKVTTIENENKLKLVQIETKYEVLHEKYVELKAITDECHKDRNDLKNLVHQGQDDLRKFIEITTQAQRESHQDMRTAVHDAKNAVQTVPGTIKAVADMLKQSDSGRNLDKS